MNLYIPIIPVVKMDTHIFLLYGLGAHAVTLLPLELYLNHLGYLNTHIINYPVDTLEYDKCLDYLDKYMENYTDKNAEIILIGQSMGGVYSNNLHKKGWKIKQAIYIGSPLHGANLLNQLESVLPTNIKNMFNKLPYDFLKNKGTDEIPPHPYKTITMGWFNSQFDGCVYKNEAILDANHNTHLKWADHRTVFANPRLWYHVGSLLE